MPNKPKTIGRLARALLHWRGYPEGHVRAEENWSQAVWSWGSARYIGSVNFEDVQYVLARSKGISADRLLWLRSRIWWGLNDRFRSRSDGSPLPDVSSWPVAVERTNMEVLLDMLRNCKVQSWHMIQQGELLRLPGRFDEAVAVLNAVPADGHSEVSAVKIERLARRGDTRVRELSVPRR